MHDKWNDDWCRRSDVVIEGLPWARKLVDYIIVWASSLEELSLRINEITSRCEKSNIILSKKKFGLGFALCQKTPEGHLYIVICASKSLTDTQRRYSIIELECLAIKWAILKCPFYLLRLPTFTVVTDHRPLEGVFKKTT